MCQAILGLTKCYFDCFIKFATAKITLNLTIKMLYKLDKFFWLILMDCNKQFRIVAIFTSKMCVRPTLGWMVFPKEK